MSNLDIHFSSKSSEWETPKNIFNLLNREFSFELDAAATNENKLCDKFFTQNENALIQDWSKYYSVWCNPPYGRLISKFVKKGYEESLKGSTVVFLVPARTDTKWWFDYCSKGEIRFIKGRLKFDNRSLPSWKADGSHLKSPAPFPCAIVIFDKNISPNTKYVDIKDS